VDIARVDENMTQLIDFHSLESTFSDGEVQQWFISTQQPIWRNWSAFFFGQLQSQTPPRCFPNVKDKSRRFKRNTIDLRFGFAETFGLFCLFAAFDSIPN